MTLAEGLEDLLARGDRLRDGGDLSGALALYRQAVEAAPDLAKGHFKLATVQARQGQPEEAEASYREAIRISPCYVEAYGNLGVLLFTGGNWDEAERCYRNALANNPNYFEAHVNLARLLFVASRSLESLYFARRASELKPDSALAIERVGLAYGKLGRIDESLAELRRAIAIDPAVASPWVSLGGVLQALGHYEESDAAYLQAMALDDEDPIPRANRAFWANYREMPRELVWQRHAEFGRWVRRRLGPIREPEAATQRPDPARRLRVGFVSADLRRHSVGYFAQGALTHLDHRRFQLYAYFDHHSEDTVSIGLKPMFHQWRDIFAKTDDVVLEQIRRDRIDILVDLAGHTGSNRMRLFARRAAPVQVTYLGYPNTTGLDCMDYRLTDRWADPEGDGDEFHSETLWRLPHIFLCYTAPLDHLDVAEPPLLRNGYVTFGSFNNRIKISESCLELWLRLLDANPLSRLVLKSIQGTEDEMSRRGLLNRFLERGIDPARIDVRAQVTDLEGHLGMYSEIDIALDTFPYGGTTTTCEALWMGVPVIALKGDRHAARVGESLLMNLGLPELVAQTPEDYLGIAGDLAADTGRLVELRRGMRTRMLASRIMDSRAFGKDLGEALHGMWLGHCSRFASDLPVESTARDDQGELLRLLIGDGLPSREGWRRVAPIQEGGIDFLGDVRILSTFADESCAEIGASHVLQKLPPQDILPVLNDIYRVLVPGGILYLSVPDFDELAALFSSSELSNADKFQVMRTMFGTRDSDRDMNRIGLGFDFLVDYLADVGFDSVEHVESFGLFGDAEQPVICGRRISLNLIVTKQGPQ
jgi:predicted O-linked N-acetylglucosamine transferase (SPINDLY family)/predicted SAM-dependent methyltransferase